MHGVLGRAGRRGWSVLSSNLARRCPAAAFGAQQAQMSGVAGDDSSDAEPPRPLGRGRGAFRDFVRKVAGPVREAVAEQSDDENDESYWGNPQDVSEALRQASGDDDYEDGEESQDDAFLDAEEEEGGTLNLEAEWDPEKRQTGREKVKARPAARAKPWSRSEAEGLEDDDMLAELEDFEARDDEDSHSDVEDGERGSDDDGDDDSGAAGGGGGGDTRDRDREANDQEKADEEDEEDLADYAEYIARYEPDGVVHRLTVPAHRNAPERIQPPARALDELLADLRLPGGLPLRADRPEDLATMQSLWRGASANKHMSQEQRVRMITLVARALASRPDATAPPPPRRAGAGDGSDDEDSDSDLFSSDSDEDEHAEYRVKADAGLGGGGSSGSGGSGGSCGIGGRRRAARAS